MRPERDEVEVRAWQTRVSWLVLEERDLHESLKLPKPGGERPKALEAVGMAPSPKTPAHQASQPHKVAKVLYLDQGGPEPQLLGNSEARAKRSHQCH